MRSRTRILMLTTALLCPGFTIPAHAHFNPDTRLVEGEQNIERRADIYNSRGFLLRRTGAYDRAIRNLTKAIEIDPGHMQALANRGVAWRKKGRYSRAVADLSRAIEIDPQRPALLINRGMAFEGMAAFRAAGDDYSRVIAISPGHAAAFRRRGDIRRNLGQYAAAIADYDRAIRLDGKAVDAFFQRGKTHLLAGHSEQAEADLQHIARLSPKLEAALYNTYCWELALAGRTREALDYCERSLKVKPGRANTLDSRAFVYWQQGRVEEARADLDAARSAKPGITRTSVRFAEFQLLLIQKALVLQGYGELKVKGRLDRKTGEAIRAFERARGLPTTGEPSDTVLRGLRRKDVRSELNAQ